MSFGEVDFAIGDNDFGIVAKITLVAKITIPLRVPNEAELAALKAGVYPVVPRVDFTRTKTERGYAYRCPQCGNVACKSFEFVPGADTVVSTGQIPPSYIVGELRSHAMGCNSPTAD